MKNIFIIGFVVFVQSGCLASEKIEEVGDISRTHNLEINKETGDKIYYPKEYESYQKFKEEYIETKYIDELLAIRLHILKDYINVFNSNPKASDYLYYTNRLDRNEIALTENAKPGTLNSISFTFDNNYLSLTNHTLQVASVLKEHMGKNSPGELNDFITILENHAAQYRERSVDSKKYLHASNVNLEPGQHLIVQ